MTYGRSNGKMAPSPDSRTPATGARVPVSDEVARRWTGGTLSVGGAAGRSVVGRPRAAWCRMVAPSATLMPVDGCVAEADGASTNPPPGTTPACRSECLSATRPGRPPIVTLRADEGSTSSTHVNARAPDNSRIPSAVSICAMTLPRKSTSTPFAVGARTPNGGTEAESVPNARAASRSAIAPPGCSASATDSTAMINDPVDSDVSAMYITTSPVRTTNPSPAAMPTVYGSRSTRNPSCRP
jgi:hypothetical protein